MSTKYAAILFVGFLSFIGFCSENAVRCIVVHNHEQQFIQSDVAESLCIELSYRCVKEPSADA